jgi:hypothetical protein
MTNTVLKIRIARVRRVVSNGVGTGAIAVAWFLARSLAGREVAVAGVTEADRASCCG